MKQRKSGWKPPILGLFLLVFALSAVSLGTARPGDKPPPAAAPAQASNYIGGEACLDCHDIRDSFAENPHYKSWNDESLSWDKRGCESCHGPGEAHIDAGGDLDLLFNFNKATSQEISDQCLDCHLEGEEHGNFLRNEHGLNTVGCTDCHSIHSAEVRSPFLKASEPALCYDCHGEVRAQFNRPFHHKVHEGMMGCSDCHNEHGGFNLRQTSFSTGTDSACYECHADKQGPFVFEHPPVKVEGCGSCHDVHGSTNPRMLKRAEQRFLCLDCHSNTVGVPGALTPVFHNLSQASWQSCTSCHIQIHGSNISSVFFE